MRSILLAALILPAAFQAAQAQAPSRRCFFVSEFRNWRAPNDKTIYIRAGVNDIYRLDLAYSCRPLSWPGTHLNTTFRGSGSVCSALDWDIKAAESFSDIPVPCMVRTMTALSPAEAKALPKGSRP